MLSGKLSVIGLSLALGAPLQAQDPAPWFQVSGFGTLGLAGTDNHQVGFRRDNGQPYYGLIDQPNAKTDSRLGLQLDGRITDNLRATLQVVSQDNYDGNFRPQVEWAFLSWNPAHNLQLRLGRVGLDQILGVESRDVGYSYLWARPIVAIMGGSPLEAFDGGDLAETFALGGDASLKVKGFAGTAFNKVPIKDTDPYSFKDSPVAGLLAEFQQGAWQARLDYSQLRDHNGYTGPLAALGPALQAYGAVLNDPGLAVTAQNVDLQGVRTRLWTFSTAYDQGPVQFMGVFQQSQSNRPSVGPTTRSGMLSLGYRLGEVEPFLAVSRAVSEAPPTPYVGALPYLPDPYAQLVASLVPPIYFADQTDQTTWTGGLRWDFAANLDLKVQVDELRSHSVDGLYVLQPGWNGHLVVFSVTLDFVFGRGR